MTPRETDDLLDQYRVGLEAELTLLRQIVVLAGQQRVATGARDFERFARESDARDHATRALTTIEDRLTHVRRVLDADRAQTMSARRWPEIVRLRTDASAMAAEILTTDRQSLQALADSEVVRRTALAGLEKGETTLAAYRRVLAPPISPAALVDTRG